MTKVTIQYDNGNVEELETEHVIVVGVDTESGDFDFHGTNSPDFIKRLEQIHGLARYRRFLQSGLMRSK